MIRKAVLGILIVLWCSSCTEDEVIPRTNPRFSVAFVQSIDGSGAEFAARMVDYGSEEILEYGFVYGKGALSIERNNYVSEKGVPDEEFRLKSTHSMPSGSQIQVSAFVRTSLGVVYSEGYGFTSQGTTGFIFDRLEVDSEVYFGDTIRVFARNLSRIPTDYSAMIQGVFAPVANITQGSFDVIIPREVGFQEGVGPVQTFGIELKVVDKILKINQPIRFRAPEFTLGAPQELAYIQNVFIRGKYLYDENLRVRYSSKTGENFLLDLKVKNEEELQVALNALFSEPNPTLELLIRGQVYPLSGLIKLKETKIAPQQGTSFKGFSGVATITGENFNPLLKDYNRLEVTPNTFKTQILSVSATEIELSYEFDFQDNGGSRTTEVRMINGGILSQNSFKLEWTDPAIPYLLTGYEVFTLDEGRSVSLLGKGYMVSTLGIFEADVQARTFKKLAENPTPGKHPARIFVQAAEGKLYFATYAGPEPSSTKLFFVFDPVTKVVSSLPDIPSTDNSFQSLVYHQGALYYQGDQISNIGEDGFIKRVKFDLARRSWEKLPDLYQPDEYRNSFPHFRSNGAIFSVGTLIEPGLMSSAIFRFNTATFEWELEKALVGNLASSESNELIVIGNKVYMKSLYNFHEVDLVSGTVRNLGVLNDRNAVFSPSNGFQVGDKFYYYYNDRFWEFDPVYF